jgi:hypothetical protein
VSNELERMWPNLRYYPNICLEGLRKTTKSLSQDSRSPGRDLNLGPPKYEAGVLTTQLQCSVENNEKHECLVMTVKRVGLPIVQVIWSMGSREICCHYSVAGSYNLVR